MSIAAIGATRYVYPVPKVAAVAAVKRNASGADEVKKQSQTPKNMNAGNNAVTGNAFKIAGPVQSNLLELQLGGTSHSG